MVSASVSLFPRLIKILSLRGPASSDLLGQAAGFLSTRWGQGGARDPGVTLPPVKRESTCPPGDGARNQFSGKVSGFQLEKQGWERDW